MALVTASSEVAKLMLATRPAVGVGGGAAGDLPGDGDGGAAADGQEILPGPVEDFGEASHQVFLSWLAVGLLAGPGSDGQIADVGGGAVAELVDDGLTDLGVDVLVQRGGLLRVLELGV